MRLTFTNITSMPALQIEAGGMVLRHVLEHIPQPMDFLASIANANGGKGKIYLEFRCLDWILRKYAWFDIFMNT